MSITPLSPAPMAWEEVQTWVNSRWKNPCRLGQFSAEINTLYTATKRADVFEAMAEGISKLQYSGFLGRKDDDSKALLDALDQSLLKMQKDGRMAAVQTKWYGRTFELPDHVPEPTP